MTMLLDTLPLIGSAFLAGLLSFFSACVLPLVPPYFVYLSGASIEEMTHPNAHALKWRVLGLSTLFVLGFSTIFISLGASATSIGQWLRAYTDLLIPFGGFIIAIMGAHFLGLFRLSFLSKSTKLEIEKPPGLWGAYVMGLIFAIGWTPCTGPLLGTSLALASAQETLSQGIILLSAYSLGLGLPFLTAALLIEPFLKLLTRFKNILWLMEKASGILLMILGIVLMIWGRVWF